MSSRLTQWLYQLQHRLSITRREGLAILSLLALFLGGLTVRYVQMHHMSPPARAPVAAGVIAAGESVPGPGAVAVPDSVRAAASEEESAAESAAGVSAASAASAADPEGDDRIDLNAATASDLEALSGIGPALAGRIVAHRARRPFRSVDDLTQVRGIGDKTLARIRDQVTVGN